MVMTTETRRHFQVTQDNGLHLRLASQFARAASLFESEVAVSSHGQVANGKSTLDLLCLAACCGDWLDLEAHGADADAAVEALSELVASWNSDE
jgi:phosphotransferase system HPr (HPr) family protein